MRNSILHLVHESIVAEKVCLFNWLLLLLLKLKPILTTTIMHLKKYAKRSLTLLAGNLNLSV